LYVSRSDIIVITLEKVILEKVLSRQFLRYVVHVPFNNL